MSQRLTVALLVGVLVACLLWGYSYERRLYLAAAAVEAETKRWQAALEAEREGRRVDRQWAQRELDVAWKEVALTRTYVVDLLVLMRAAGVNAPAPPWTDRPPRRDDDATPPDP